MLPSDERIRVLLPYFCQEGQKVKKVSPELHRLRETGSCGSNGDTGEHAPPGGTRAEFFHFPHTKITCVKQCWGHQLNLLRHNPQSMERCGSAWTGKHLCFFPHRTSRVVTFHGKTCIADSYSTHRWAFPSTQKSTGIRKTLPLTELFFLPSRTSWNSC